MNINVIKKIFLVFMMLGALAVAVVLARSGLADYYAHQGYQIMQGWQGESVATDESIKTAITWTQKARRLAPRHPAYLHRLGYLHRLLMTTDLAHRSAHGEAALGYLKASLTSRPQWPGTWSELVLTKLALAQRDDSLYTAMRNATKFGAWDEAVHRQLTYTVSGFDSFPPDIQSLLLDNIERGLRSPTNRAALDVAKTIKSRRVTVDFVWQLGARLGAFEWPAHSLHPITDLTLYYWAVFTAETRRLLTAKLAQAVVLDQRNGVLRQLQKSRKLGLVCPYLPRAPKYQPFCTAKNLIGR